MGSVQGLFSFFSVFFVLFMLPLVSYVEGTSLYTSLRYLKDIIIIRPTLTLNLACFALFLKIS